MSIYVPPMYFSTKDGQSERGPLNLPCEVLSKALTDFCDYGTVARLACTSKTYSKLLVECSTDSFELACAYFEGKNGLEKNPSMAVRLLQKICSNEENTEDQKEHLSRAKYMLATCHLTGNGTVQDTDKGIELLENSANVFQDSNSAYYLATLYENGEHRVELCPEKAARWFLYAAELGHAESMVEYALHLELGVGVDQDDAQALQWYLRAAEAGSTEANYSIGECYEEAKGVPHDLNEACLWYFKSAEKGCDDSVRALKRLEDIARIVLPGVRNLLHG